MIKVAPDHQDVKNVINTFTQTLHNENVNFFGNVNIGTDLRISDLTRAYDCVVLAYGSASEKYLNIPGEKEFSNLVSAKDLVSWYNGLPPQHNGQFNIDLSAKHAIVIGAGNVAVDVARILLSPIEKLEKTDISSKALDIIRRENRVEHVSIVARRGILNAAFTIKELRELTKIECLNCDIDLKQFDNIKDILEKLSRPRKRLTELMFSLAKQGNDKSKNKTLSLIFLKSPLEIVGDSESRKVTGVKFQNNKYNFDFKKSGIKLDSEEALNALPVIPDEEKGIEIMKGGLVVRSVGFKNVRIDPEVPFDKNSGVVPNEKGKVIGKEGLYCTGWIKRGPRGVILDTTSDAHETAKRMCEDMEGMWKEGGEQKRGGEEVGQILRERNVRFVDKSGWRKIDEEEVRRGKLSGKPREKFQTIDEMLQVAFSK